MFSLCTHLLGVIFVVWLEFVADPVDLYSWHRNNGGVVLFCTYVLIDLLAFELIHLFSDSKFAQQFGVSRHFCMDCIIWIMMSCFIHSIQVDYPEASSFREWAVNLFELMNSLSIKSVRNSISFIIGSTLLNLLIQCHLLGCDLGGYLALWFAKTFPQNIVSIVMCNSYVSTDEFNSKYRLRSL